MSGTEVRLVLGARDAQAVVMQVAPEAVDLALIESAHLGARMW
jgi:hypothetical protein